MRKLRPKRVALVLGLAAMLAIPAVVAALPDQSATVQFGHDEVGSPFPPPSGHDASFNAKDNDILSAPTARLPNFSTADWLPQANGNKPAAGRSRLNTYPSIPKAPARERASAIVRFEMQRFSQHRGVQKAS